ncbi:MAG: hypothetical protein OHK0052_00990 [Anaerolineales bacterium]
MRATLAALPVLGLVLMLQIAIVSQIALLNGHADLLLLVLCAWAIQERVRNPWYWVVIGGLLIQFVTAMPLGVPLIAYAAGAGIALLLRRRLWQSPIFGMLSAVFLASLLNYGIQWFALTLAGSNLPIAIVMSSIILPGTLLNLLVAIPVYGWVRDLAEWLYPDDTLL